MNTEGMGMTAIDKNDGILGKTKLRRLFCWSPQMVVIVKEPPAKRQSSLRPEKKANGTFDCRMLDFPYLSK